MPLDEAMPIAKQIAEGLETAHEQGIIHRDLKPANIKVREDGTVKILDFGLAKALEPKQPFGVNVTQSPTITTPAVVTGVGVILGSAAYMSPEQAKGRPADKRSDVWAFGCVLYEMLTGKRAFEGEDVSDTLANVLRGGPQWTALPPDVPLAVRKLIKGCLERDLRQRVGDIAAVRYVLRDADAATATVVGATAQRSPQPAWRRAAPLAIALVAVGALGIIAGRAMRPAARPPKVTRFAVTLPAGQRFNETGGQVIAISPDGSHIAYVANQRIYARALSDEEARPIAGTEANADRLSNVIFSPDGQSVAFSLTNASAVTGTMRQVPLAGGTPVTMGALGAVAGPEVTWRDDGIVFVDRRQGAVVHLDANGRLERLAAVTDGMVVRPQILPDGDTLLFAFAPGVADPIGAPLDTWDKAKIVVQSRKTGERKTLIDGGSAPTYVPTGHLLYVVGGTLFAAPFDYQRRQLTGGVVSVVEGVGRFASAVSASPTVYYSVADNGTLIYVPGPAGASVGRFDVAYVDAKEQVERLKLPPAGYNFPRLSHDGKRLAVQADDGKSTNV
jgi:serine/threonine-protein kinase